MLAQAYLSGIISNHYHYVVLLSRVSTADAQAQNDTYALMEDLIYCYWDEFPSVAEPSNAPPTEIGASATHGNEQALQRSACTFGGSTTMTKHRVRDNQSIRVLNDHDEVHAIHDELRNQLGELYYAISKSYIYSLISQRTGYCTKSIAYILNHTKVSKKPTT